MALPLALLLPAALLLPLAAIACQFNCYSELRGSFCCETDETGTTGETGMTDPYAYKMVQQRPGLCPPVRRSLQEASIPYECFDDTQCPYQGDKCCPDVILKHKVCKTAIYSDMNHASILAQYQQQRRRQTTDEVTTTAQATLTSSPTGETTQTTTRTSTTSSRTAFITWDNNKPDYPPLFPHVKPRPPRAMYPFYPSYNPNAHRSFMDFYPTYNR